jgi:phage-related protein
MQPIDKRRVLLQSATDLLKQELSVENKDRFTRSYLEQRLAELLSYLDGENLSQGQLESAKNIVSSMRYAIDQNAAYDDPTAQFYKAAVNDLKSELEAACEDH